MTFISQFSDVDLNYFSASNTVWFYWQDAIQASYAVLRQLLLTKRSVCMICTSVCCYVEHAGTRLPTRVTLFARIHIQDLFVLIYVTILKQNY